MKKAAFYFLILSCFISIPSYAKESKVYQGSGEVITTDPLYSRVTLETGSIKDLSAPGTNEFIVSSPDLLKNLSAHDLVNFEITGSKADAVITKIEKTGIAPEKDTRSLLGKTAQDVLTGTGQAVKTVTTPITPIGAAVGEVVGSTTEATGNVVGEAKMRTSERKEN